MQALNQEALRNTSGGGLVLPLLLYLGYRAYQRRQAEQEQEEGNPDWGGGSSGGGGAGGSW
jgi:uncharacterized membrane protein YgcG